MMAHSLGLTVVAEGVEQEVQRAFLERHGCDLYQGHLLSRPLPASEMGLYLKARQGPQRVVPGARKTRARVQTPHARALET